MENVFLNAGENLQIYYHDLVHLVNSCAREISVIKPSEWSEANRKMTSDLSAVEGMFDYWNSPYSREIIDCLSEDCPVDTVFVIKGAQIGFSAGVIENGIGWIISQNPGNTLLLVGHQDNLKDSLNKIEQVLDGANMRHMITSGIKRKRNTKSGDTDERKDFSGGYLKLGITNHKSLRNMTMRYGFIDDFEAMKGATKEAGSTVKMIEQRFAAMANKKKLFFISTPELKETSNIEPGYLKGDQRKFHIPCPCCHEKIIIDWEVQSELVPDKMAGIYWELNQEGELDEDSVGYVCYKCGGFFDDREKMEWLNKGEWVATAKSIRPGLRSYHVSALYAPVFMDGWTKYIRDYLECTPNGRERNEAEEQQYKTFVNVVLGRTYDYSGKILSANKLQKNIRQYEIGIIPEKLSIADGNGRIVMVTCGVDLNGKEDDARLDYEIVGHAENGATYSICHRSIGTFIPKDKYPERREHFTYKYGARNSVWKLFEKLLTTKLSKDTGGSLPIFATGLDSGYQSNYAYQFSDKTSAHNVFCLKGDPQKHLSDSGDYKTYRPSKDRGNLYLVESNHTKTKLAIDMDLNWSQELNDEQPPGFMNFPTPSDGLYLFNNFFSHFESESKIMNEMGKFVWRKITGKQNHLFDCRLYSNVARDILLDLHFKAQKTKNGVWKDYANWFLGKKA